MAEGRERMSPRASTLEVLERMLALADKMGLEITEIGVSAIALHMEGNTIPKVASQLGITRSAASELIWRGLFELRHLEKAFDEVIDENTRLKNVSEEHELLRQAVGSDEADLMISRQRVKNKVKAGVIDEKVSERLSLSIYQLGLSTRVCYALRAGGILTLGDIVKCKRSSFEDFRSLGPKRLAEIDKVVADAGLTYEYDL